MSELSKLIEYKLKGNKRLSRRGLAVKAGITPSMMSQILNGKKNPSVETAKKILQALGASSEDQQKVIADILKKQSPGTQDFLRSSTPKDLKNRDVPREMVLEKDFTILSEWYYLAILDLTTTSDFDPDPAFIAERLGISVERAKSAIYQLLEEGFLKRAKDGGLEKTNAQMRLPTNKSVDIVRHYHKQILLKILDHMDKNRDEKAFEKRYVTGTMMAIDTQKIPQAKRMILEFMDALSGYLSESDQCDEVYKLGIQLVPLTKERKK